MATIKIRQIKSRIGMSKVECRTLDSLGLKKMNKVVEHNDNAAVRGMIRRASHLVRVEE